MPAEDLQSNENLHRDAGAGGVAGLLSQVSAIARSLGDGEAADRVQAESGAVATHAARVVVVGEQKRGKSSLINALLGRRGLLPVDVAVATSVHISVYGADREQAWVVDDDDPSGREIQLAQIGEYAALDPESMEMRHPGVREVSVGLPDPLLLAGVVLIDTPGVGGLARGHAALTLAALARADALLFVVNGRSELSASETGFLAQATERVGTVVFVMAQTDKYDKWRQVLARNQALIVEHAPRFADAPWYPVSSRRRLDAVLAAQMGDTARAVSLEERSGFGALADVLGGQIAGRAADLRAANAAWAARRVLDKLIAGQQQRLLSLAQDPQLDEAMREQRARLNKYLSAHAVWRQKLADGFKDLNRDLDRLYQRRQADLQITADRWIADASAATVTQIAHDVGAGVQALWADLESAALARAGAIASDSTAELEADGIGSLALDMPYPEQLRQMRSLSQKREKRSTGASGILARYYPAYPGISMTYFAGHLLLASVNPLFLLPASIAVGRLMYLDKKAKEDTAQAKAALQLHIKEVMTEVRVEMPKALQDGAAHLQRAIEGAIDARMTELIGEMEAVIAKHNADLQASKEELGPQRKATADKLKQLQGLADLADRLSNGLGGYRQDPA